MATTATVKRALAALAARTDVERGPHLAVVDEAEAALDDLDRAAGFVDSVGLDRLETAVETADTVGDADAAERGREALAAYRAFRRAAAGRRDPEPTDPQPTDSQPTDLEPTDAEPTDAEPTDAEPTDAASTVERDDRGRHG